MATPRVFVSSTYYDLKHIRSSLDLFIESLGFEPILSEKGDIAYSPDAPLDESCYREASSADIFVLIIGGRYGSEATNDHGKKPLRTFYERYESITKKEYESAINRDIPTYILIESSVYSEYHTYLRNKQNDATNYAHVDSVNIFRLIEEILARPRNNPVHTFERFSEIEKWLRDQWAGLFRELLHRTSDLKQIESLSGQIDNLKAINNTLKKYMEAVMSGASSEDSKKLIASEEKRLEDLERRELAAESPWGSFVIRRCKISPSAFIECLTQAKSFDDFADKISKVAEEPLVGESIRDTLRNSESARSDFNKVRRIFELPGFRKLPTDLDSPEDDKGIDDQI